MRIITASSGSKYVDQELFDHIGSIHLNYTKTIPNNSNIFFAKNCAIPRLITDFMDTGIKRVIKKENANYCVIGHIALDNYPRHYDPITNTVGNFANETEVVYSISNVSSEILATIQQILDFINLGNTIKYVYEVNLNQSVNNGLIVNMENYDSMLELIKSGSRDNRDIVGTMLMNSDIKANLDWILYLYHGTSGSLNILQNNITLKNLLKDHGFLIKYNIDEAFYNTEFDKIFKIITNPEVKEMFIQLKRNQLRHNIDAFLEGYLKTKLFRVTDFTLQLIEENGNKIN